MASVASGWLNSMPAQGAAQVAGLPLFSGGRWGTARCAWCEKIEKREEGFVAMIEREEIRRERERSRRGKGRSPRHPSM